MFAVRVSRGEPTAAPDAPPVSDNAPATPNTVTALARLLRFEACFACIVETSYFTPAYDNEGRNAAFERWMGSCGAVIVGRAGLGNPPVRLFRQLGGSLLLRVLRVVSQDFRNNSGSFAIFAAIRALRLC